MNPEFEELAQQITKSVTVAVNAHVTDVVTATERRLSDLVTERLDSSERRLSEQARIHTEAVKSEAKLAAEGYAATLDSINRRLDSIETVVNEKLAHHDQVLANHGERLTSLERPRLKP